MHMYYVNFMLADDMDAVFACTTETIKELYNAAPWSESVYKWI